MKQSLTITILAGLIITSDLLIAGTDPVAEINKYFAEAAAGRGYFITLDVLNSLAPKEFLEIAGKHIKASSPRVRYAAVDITGRRALLLPAGEKRYPFVRLLSEAVSDTAGIVNAAALRELRYMNFNDFSRDSRKILSQQIQIPNLRPDELLKITGFAGCRKSMPFIRQAYLYNPVIKENVKWSAYLAMARMGDEECLAYCIDKARKHPVNDSLVVAVFPDLVYTRTEDAMDFMLQEILCEAENCFTFNPGYDTTIVCAYKIMELIAPAIKNFPVPFIDGYLAADDYSQALSEVRQWIRNGAAADIETSSY